MKTTPSLRFPKEAPPGFFLTLRSRIQARFTEQGSLRYGGTELLIKAVLLLVSWRGMYAYVLFGGVPRWELWLLCIGLGLGKAMVGASVMHDACHGSFSRHRWINQLASHTMLLLGGDKLVWQTSHNILHHSFTNIYGHDIDLDAGNGILRFTDQAEWKPHHRYQAWYAYFLYSLLTLTWVFFTDLVKMRRFVKAGLTYGRATNVAWNWIHLILGKVFYFGFWLGLPLWLTDLVWWQIGIGFLTMHLVAGIYLTLIFQLAHLTPESAMPSPNDNGKMEDAWAVHQLQTTANWAMQNPVANWITGGLNHQIEHHLFPRISHVHYPRIATIVQKTAEEFGVPYVRYPTFWSAVQAHVKHLKELGEPPLPMDQSESETSPLPN
ncbi:MAG: acyl-CoA desaturase [Bacteroidota bacterium]